MNVKTQAECKTTPFFVHAYLRKPTQMILPCALEVPWIPCHQAFQGFRGCLQLRLSQGVLVIRAYRVGQLVLVDQEGQQVPEIRNIFQISVHTKFRYIHSLNTGGPIGPLFPGIPVAPGEPIGPSLPLGPLLPSDPGIPGGPGKPNGTDLSDYLNRYHTVI